MCEDVPRVRWPSEKCDRHFSKINKHNSGCASTTWDWSLFATSFILLHASLGNVAAAARHLHCPCITIQTTSAIDCYNYLVEANPNWVSIVNELVRLRWFGDNFTAVAFCGRQIVAARAQYSKWASSCRISFIKTRHKKKDTFGYCANGQTLEPACCVIVELLSQVGRTPNEWKSNRNDNALSLCQDNIWMFAKGHNAIHTWNMLHCAQRISPRVSISENRIRLTTRTNNISILELASTPCARPEKWATLHIRLILRGPALCRIVSVSLINAGCV